MGRATFTEVQCRTALNQPKGMPFKWSLNPYRGCEHACTYCYARVTHAYMDLLPGKDFEELIFVKRNIVAQLRKELARRTWQRETVAMGTVSDPYQRAEGKYRLTRGCLEALADFRTPGNVTTKGTLVVRDIDVLRHLGERAGSGVSFSLITLDDAVWRALEPGTPPPRQRLRAMERLAASGVACGLALAPVLPGLTDSPAQLDAVVSAAVEHGAQWLWSGTLHLEPAVRDWFLESLERYFPQSVPTYTRVFGTRGSPGAIRYTPKAYAERMQRQVATLKARYGVGELRRPAPQTPRGERASGEAVAARAGMQDYPLPQRTGDSEGRQLALPL